MADQVQDLAQDDTPAPSERARIRRASERAHYDSATIHAIVDAAWLCHVSFACPDVLCLPTACWRIDDMLYIHGSNGSRMMKHLASGAPACVAITHLDGLVTPSQRQRTAEEVAALQQPDGGWSMSRFGTFARVDKTPLETIPDGYATALAVLTLQQANHPNLGPALSRGLAWLGAHQEASGRWGATSLNKQRDPASDPARFMNDAATAYAVLALSRAAAPTRSR